MNVKLSERNWTILEGVADGRVKGQRSPGGEDEAILSTQGDWCPVLEIVTRSCRHLLRLGLIYKKEESENERGWMFWNYAATKKGLAAIHDHSTPEEEDVMPLLSIEAESVLAKAAEQIWKGMLVEKFRVEHPSPFDPSELLRPLDLLGEAVLSLKARRQNEAASLIREVSKNLAEIADLIETQCSAEWNN